ncbi:MAG: response regulator [Proteobacteria bacterium]|nr:MAG: response regulator [Pseudomonadota bacterium]
MKILIVDDEPLVRKSLGRAFRAKGHEVTEASDGSEGLSQWLKLQSDGQGPDVVFLDVLMPGLSGPELLKEIQPKLKPGPSGRNAKVVLMSAYSGEHNISTAQAMGADVFVPKPFDDIFALVTRAEELHLSTAGS